ncbi:MAG: NAD-dependent protein deacylase [Solobacterium sp.]|nr:NAD-dependent protein deacylase [Solobacterium sp.]
MNMNQIEQLQTIIDNGKRIVFFTGAGVSTDSGIPDFRSTDGLYNQQYDYPPETIISRSFFDHDPEEFYRFYRDRMIYPEARPNTVHKFIAELEKTGRCLGVITQNIDGLHTDAGSKHVCELHGSILRNHCMRCGKFYPLSAITESTGVPRCTCGGIIKPDVVLYEEPLDMQVSEDALDMITKADVLIVLGTSLVVYPAAGYIRYFRGDHLVLINRSSTPYDKNADLLIQTDFDQVFPKLTVR